MDRFEILQNPVSYADKLLALFDPAEAEELVREAKANDPSWRITPQSWCDAVVAALHTPR